MRGNRRTQYARPRLNANAKKKFHNNLGNPTTYPSALRRSSQEGFRCDCGSTSLPNYLVFVFVDPSVLRHEDSHAEALFFLLLLSLPFFIVSICFSVASLFSLLLLAALPSERFFFSSIFLFSFVLDSFPFFAEQLCCSFLFLYTPTSAFAIAASLPIYILSN